jgi:hypothetical protein
MKMNAAVLWNYEQDWSVEEVDLDPPQAGEVLVSFEATGLCHSDHHIRTGDLPAAEAGATQEVLKAGFDVVDYVAIRDAQTLEQCAADPCLRLMDDRTLGDGRLVFQSDVRGVFESAPSRFGINRNVRFIDPPEQVNHFHDSHELGGARVVQGEISPEG